MPRTKPTMYGLTSGALIQLGNAKQHRPLLGGCQLADHPTEVIWARGVGKARTRSATPTK